ncbi:glutathione S-transferase [Nannocystis exedens]|uniref:Glutathione S-transferase n=1 Tax=Nannocystis exedens TaxID=54 RepID=A0A1I2E1X0_9BACT|nr:glutathione S-transferase [Nannocystis exedens]PCC69220.1 glutathione S-transferase [Nannocystis exedens]SFE86676.1 glutathione S-transferase [Nannocystis exedens]
MTRNRTLKLYRHPLSGHAHRVQLFLSLLGLPVELVDVDLRAGAQRQPQFLALNRFGQVPVLDDDGTIVADSNAILVYLARKHGGEAWSPSDPVGAAAVQRWLSVAAGPLASGPAAARLVTVFGAKFDAAEVIARAHALLRVMDAELAGRDFLAGDRATIADVACYAYVAHAPEGNVSLAEYAAVRAWLARVEALRGFVPMQASAVGLARG